MNINIPGVFGAYNLYKQYENLDAAKGLYGWKTEVGGKASACIKCGACESHCPQHIHIIDSLSEVSQIIE